MLHVRTIMTGVAGSPYYTNAYFGGSGTGDAQIVHERMRAFWFAIAGFINTNLVISVEGSVTEIDPADGSLLGVYSLDTDEVDPTSTGEPLPPATQGLLRLTTADIVNNRVVRGRIFIPGPTEVANTLGVPSASYLAGINTASEGLLGSGVEDSTGIGVWSRPAPEAATPRAGLFAPATAASAWQQWAVLRSRRD